MIDLKDIDSVFDTMKTLNKENPGEWKKTIAEQLESNDGIDEFRNLAKMKAIIQNFVEKHNITCAETIYQVDNVIVDAYDFIQELVELVGYKEREDDE